MESLIDHSSRLYKLDCRDLLLLPAHFALEFFSSFSRDCVEMYRLLILLSILKSAQSSCPTGWDLARDGECRGLHSKTKVAFEEAVNTAITKCKEDQAQPVIIHNSKDYDYWSKKAISSDIVLGVVCNSKTKIWEWSDGSAIDFNPAANTVLKGNCGSGCVFFQDSNGWQKDCGHVVYNFAFYCTKQLSTQSFSNGDRCNGWARNSENGYCYQVITNPANGWKDAHAYCYYAGANLTAIHSQQENEFIRRLAVSKGALNGIFIDATIFMYDTKNHFQWSDGTEWNYTYWHNGLPVESLGECLTMDTLSSTGQWVNTDCAAKLAFACKKKQGDSPPLAYSFTTWKEEGQIISSPGFPYDASTPADFILTVPAGKKVRVEIQLLEANSCCDRLLLLDNIVGGNVVADLSGQVLNATYTTKSSNLMRVSWQPNGGVNVRGLQMTFRAV